MKGMGKRAMQSEKRLKKKKFSPRTKISGFNLGFYGLNKPLTPIYSEHAP